MALFKRNIWLLFIVLLVIGALLLGYASLARWRGISDDYLERQHNIVRLLSNATHALLVTQEMMLDILGHQLIRDESYRSSLKTKPLLDGLLALNPSIVGFGLATPEGQLRFVSSNLDLEKLPNLREAQVSRESFDYALSTDKMVLGRTYFMPALDEWVIPIRKAIRDEQGRPVALMTAGLRVSGATRLFKDDLHFGPFHSILIIRSFDDYEQFHSAQQSDLQALYNKPVPPEMMLSAIAALEEATSLSLAAIKASEASYDMRSANRDGEVSQMVLKYDNRFELWSVSAVTLTQLHAEFRVVFSNYLLMYLMVSGVLFAFCRFIATAEERRRQDLVHQATHDPLTGLPNRTFLQRHYRDWIHPGASPFSLLYVDMDHFKSVNDSFGHQFGDAVLCELSGRIRHWAGDDGVIVRQGGDEFLVLTPLTDTTRLLVYAQDIISALSEPCRVGQFSIQLGASIGIAKYPEHGETLDMMLRAADIAMFESKRLKHSIHLFSDTMQEGYLNRLVIERHLRTALENDELFMVYQPQIDADGRFFGVESLLRWRNPELGMVPPDHFIPVAEASGLMPALGHFVLTRTLSEMRELQVQLARNWQVSINISVRQFMQTFFLDDLKRIIEESGIERANVTLEITESLFIEDIDYILGILHSVHHMGVRISMDDFGTGYSSLSMLRRLPIDELKIDKSFVDTILNDAAARKMIQNIIAIGKNLDMSVLAEGVETVEQEAMLKSFDCDCFQGYYYSRPLATQELHDLLTKWLST
jgi:diguanylate cyclase